MQAIEALSIENHPLVPVVQEKLLRSALPLLWNIDQKLDEKYEYLIELMEKELTMFGELERKCDHVSSLYQDTGHLLQGAGAVEGAKANLIMQAI